MCDFEGNCMRLVCLFSGGKDSVFAANAMTSQGHDVELLSVSGESDSMMFHHPNALWREVQAKCMGLAYREIAAKNEDELALLEKELAKMKKGEKGIDGIVSGAVASDYQKERIDAICERLSLRSFAPLWHTSEQTLIEMVSSCEVYVVSVAAEGLGEKWLGRRLDSNAIEEIKGIRPAVNPFFEGGEGETFVADAPFFSKRILISSWDKKWDGVRGVAEIGKAKLVGKR